MLHYSRQSSFEYFRSRYVTDDDLPVWRRALDMKYLLNWCITSVRAFNVQPRLPGHGDPLMGRQ